MHHTSTRLLWAANAGRVGNLDVQAFGPSSAAVWGLATGESCFRRSVTWEGLIWSSLVESLDCCLVSSGEGSNTRRQPARVGRQFRVRTWLSVLRELELAEPGLDFWTAVSKKKECIPEMREAGVPPQRAAALNSGKLHRNSFPENPLSVYRLSVCLANCEINAEFRVHGNPTTQV